MRYKDIMVLNEDGDACAAGPTAGATTSANVATLAVPFMGEPPKKNKKQKSKSTPVVIKRT